MCYPCPNLFVCTCLSRYHGQNRPISLPGPDYLAPDFPLIFAVSDLPLSPKFQNVYWHIRPCQRGDCIWTYLPQIQLGIDYPTIRLYFLFLKTPRKKMAMMINMKEINACTSFFEIYVFYEKERTFLSTRMKKYVYRNAYSSSAYFVWSFCFFVLGSTSPPFPLSKDSPRRVPCANFPLVFVGPHEGRTSNLIFRMDLLPLSIFCCINWITVSHWWMKYQWIAIW